MEYIIRKENSNEHYFYDKGLMIRKNDITRILVQEAMPNFCMLSEGKKDNIICINKRNEICYISKKGDKEKIFTLCRLKKEILVKMMRLCKTKEGFYLVFSAQYKNDIILVFCFLEENARPVIAGKMANEYFFCFMGRVYYQNENKILGYKEMVRKRMGSFFAIVENAKMPYLYKEREKIYFVYVKKGGIYLNHQLLIEDFFATFPVLERKKRDTFLFWESGGVLKYKSLNDEKRQGRIISTAPPRLCCIQNEKGVFYSYNTSINLTF